MSIITDILKEIPLSAVLKERLADADTKMAALERENASLKTENKSLRIDLKTAQDEIERLKQQPEVAPGEQRVIGFTKLDDDLLD